VLAASMAEPWPASADEQFRLSLSFLLDGIGDRLGQRRRPGDRAKRRG
jgi:hypothetical protein